MGILEIAEQVRQRAISPVELAKQCLARIEQLNPALNAFITVTSDSALAEAGAAETEIRDGNWRGPLHGIPIALKDLIDTGGVPTTAASAQYKNRIPATDADVVSRLKRAGAVLLGKQNLHEFAYGGSSVISHFGPVHNAWHPDHIAGGSSGGSATAVAAGLCFAALGTDTAGSIREPASLCGIVGLKPTYGSVSARGVIPLSLSLDHVGPLTNSVADAVLLFAAVAKTSAPTLDHVRTLASSAHKLRIGVPRSYFYEGLHHEIASAIDEALDVIAAMRAGLQDLSISVSTDRTLQAAESYSLHREMVARSPELYDPETLRRIRTGEKVSAEDLHRAQQELQQARRDILNIFQKVDVLITPTVPIPPPTIGELKTNPDSLRPTELLLLRNTRPFNVWGLPAISVPCGFTETGLPIGLQIAGAPGREDQVLALAYAYEQATEWRKVRPQRPWL
jgi:Asp-tRNA(Asn)/Glu-tRNA(Gln) amidotransferase A subunit family amidase